ECSRDTSCRTAPGPTPSLSGRTRPPHASLAIQHRLESRAVIPTDHVGVVPRQRSCIVRPPTIRTLTPCQNQGRTLNSHRPSRSFLQDRGQPITSLHTCAQRGLPLAAPEPASNLVQRNR